MSMLWVRHILEFGRGYQDVYKKFTDWFKIRLAIKEPAAMKHGGRHDEPGTGEVHFRPIAYYLVKMFVSSTYLLPPLATPAPTLV